MPNSPIAALPYPATTDAPNGPAQFQALAQATETLLVNRFTSTTDRDTRITSPLPGMLAWIADARLWTFYDGSQWYGSPRVRTVPSLALRNSIANPVAGDIAIVTGIPTLTYMYDGLLWRGMFPALQYQATTVLVTGATGESGILRLTVADPGCPYNINFRGQAVCYQTPVNNDFYYINCRNGTNLTAPATSGAILAQSVFTYSGYTVGFSGMTGTVLAGGYSIQVNLVRGSGTSTGGVFAYDPSTAPLNFMRATLTPVMN